MAILVLSHNEYMISYPKQPSKCLPFAMSFLSFGSSTFLPIKLINKYFLMVHSPTNFNNPPPLPVKVHYTVRSPSGSLLPASNHIFCKINLCCPILEGSAEGRWGEGGITWENSQDLPDFHYCTGIKLWSCFYKIAPHYCLISAIANPEKLVWVKFYPLSCCLPHISAWVLTLNFITEHLQILSQSFE